MIEVRVIVNGTWKYQDFVFTVEEAIKEDYVYWKTYHKSFEFLYQGQLLNRLLDDCSFEEEIGYLKHQISVIDNIRD